MIGGPLAMISQRRRLSPTLLLALGVLLAACSTGTTPADSSGQVAQSGAATEAATASGQAEEPLEKVEMLIAFSFVGHNSPPFLALSKGYFEEEGLDVTINEGTGGSLILQLMAANPNNTSLVGIVDLPAAAVSISQGAELKSVAAIAQTNLNGIAYRQDRGIESLSDLEGKTLALDTGGTESTLVSAVLEQNGVDESKIEIVNTEGVGGENALLEGRVDAMSVFINSQPVRLRAAGLDVGVWPLTDFGLPLVGTGLVVTQGMIDEKPEVVRGLVNALLRAWEDAQANPEESVAAQAAVLTDVEINQELQVQSLEEVIPLVFGNEEGLGFHSPEAWEEMLQFMESQPAYNLEEALPVDSYFDNSFLPSE